MTRTRSRVLCVLGLLTLIAACSRVEGPTEGWGEVVKMEGQAEPVPKVWLTDDEARFAHNLTLPDSVPKTVPFDFDRAKLKALIPWYPSVSEQYFKHLCDTEAGEWILRKAENVEGLYFARPRGQTMATAPTGRYVVEAPDIEGNMAGRDDTLADRGALFISPPFVSYQYVEEPRRDVAWQSQVTKPYVRIFGLRYREVQRGPTEAGPTIVKISDMQVIGIDQPTAPYGYTWRGAPRERDREFRVGGSEVLIFDRRTNEVMSVRRTFTLGVPFKRAGQTSVAWLGAGQCAKTTNTGSGREPVFRMALRTLNTKEKSNVQFPD